MKSKFLYPLIFIIIIAIWAYLIPHYVHTAESNELNKVDKHIDIKIRSYPIPREIFWSGIFPFYGGFLPDPHMSATEPFDMPSEITNRLEAKSIRFQGYDINPWFDDRLSEILLAIEVDNHAYQFKIENTVSPKMDYGFINFYEPIIPFIYNEKLVFITALDISRLALLSIDLPITKNGIITPIFYEQVEFKETIQYLKNKERYKILKDDLCRQFIPYIEFYENFEKCPPLPKWEPTKQEEINNDKNI